jgi:hypothetical protein
MQRVFGIALDYEDLVDHDQLRHDSVMAVLAGKLAAVGMPIPQLREPTWPTTTSGHHHSRPRQLICLVSRCRSGAGRQLQSRSLDAPMASQSRRGGNETEWPILLVE